MTPEAASVTIQQAAEGRYTSPLIAGRFQILASVVGGTYYVVDHQKTDLLIRDAGPASGIKRFASKEDAENWISSFTGVAVERKDEPSQQEIETSIEIINQGEKKMQPEVVATRAHGGVGARTKELIQQGLDNDGVIATLVQEFPNNANSLANVRWHRNALKKESGDYTPRAPRTPREPRTPVVAREPREATNGAAEPTSSSDENTLDQIGRTLQALGATLVKMEKESRALKARNEALLKNMRSMLEG